MDARHFRKARNQAGLSQQKAAAELGVSQSYLLDAGEGPTAFVAGTGAEDGSGLQAIAGYLAAVAIILAAKDD